MIIFFYSKKKYGIFSKKLIKIKGINLKKLLILSSLKHESFFIKTIRIKNYILWKHLIFPNWTNLKINSFKFTKMKLYYKNVLFIFFKYNNLKKINNTFLHKLFITKSIDIVINNNSLITTYKKKLAKQGIIFCSMSEACLFYSRLIKKYLGSTLTINDNFFATLNSFLFSDGSFCYIPKNTICPIELSTYFTLQNKKLGQFERTLIIVENCSFLMYFEGCITKKSKLNQIHIAVVELIAYNNALIKYSTFQNWYKGSTTTFNGLYNFVTKRGLCIGNKSQICWLQLELGSQITWKYPSCILIGNYSKGEFFSLSMTTKQQQVDTGTKIIHLGKKTISFILIKSISQDYSKNTVRTLVKVATNAFYSQNFTQCDSLFNNFNSSIFTYPYIYLRNSKILINYEAKVLLFNPNQEFYLKQRMITEQNSKKLIFYTFFLDILSKFSKVFQIELNALLFKIFI